MAVLFDLFFFLISYVQHFANFSSHNINNNNGNIRKTVSHVSGIAVWKNAFIYSLDPAYQEKRVLFFLSPLYINYEWRRKSITCNWISFF